MKKSLAVITVTAVLLSGLAFAQVGSTAEPAAPTVADVLSVNTLFSRLFEALQAAGLGAVLNAEDATYTVFAPTNAAFDAIEPVVEQLAEDPEALASVLTYHVVSGAVFAGDLSDGMTVETLQGETLTISVGEGGVSVNGANVVLANVPASNGVIHVIDAVLVPGQ